jgi:hypothetical protein
MSEGVADGQPSGTSRWEGLDDIVAERLAGASEEDRDYSMEAGKHKGYSGDNSDEERLRGRQSAAQEDPAPADLLELEEDLRQARRRVFGPVAGRSGMPQVYGHPVEDSPLTEPTQLLRPVQPPDEQRYQ